MRITVTVPGRPPRKRGTKSVWNTDESERVLKLRLAIREEQKNLGITGPSDAPARLTLEIYAPNTTRIGDKQTYVGDLDGFVDGICDSIQAANPSMTRFSPVFAKHDEVGPKIQLVINDDAQVAEVNARKIRTAEREEWYVLTVETVECGGSQHLPAPRGAGRAGAGTANHYLGAASGIWGPPRKWPNRLQGL